MIVSSRRSEWWQSRVSTTLSSLTGVGNRQKIAKTADCRVAKVASSRITNRRQFRNSHKSWEDHTLLLNLFPAQSVRNSSWLRCFRQRIYIQERKMLRPEAMKKVNMGGVEVQPRNEGWERRKQGQCKYGWLCHEKYEGCERRKRGKWLIWAETACKVQGASHPYSRFFYVPNGRVCRQRLTISCDKIVVCRNAL